MKKMMLMMIVLLLCGWRTSADACGGLECYEWSCCEDQQNGPQCYRPSEHTCIRQEAADPQGSPSFKLCGPADGACGAYPDAVCYDKSMYGCEGGRLIYTGGSSVTTSSPTPSTTTAPATTTTASPTSTLGSSSSSVCGGTDCGAAQCCLLNSGVGACYSSDQYTCSGGLLCPAGFQSCGGSACYQPSQYSCVNGQLQQTGGSSTSSPSTSSPSTSSPSTSSPSTSSPSTTLAPTPTPTTTQSSTTGSGSQAVKLWGLNYSAKLASGACPTLADVEADMRVLTTLTTRIRIYSIVECNQAELILRAIKNTGVELTLTLGIWLDQWHAAEYPNEMGALASVINNVGLDLVDAIIVGSETQYRRNFPAAELISYLQNTSAFLTARGYGDIDVVTADVIYNLIGNSLIQYEDAVYANQFPFWEGKKIEDAVQLVLSTVNDLINFAGNKRVVLSETGWPTEGSNFGDSAPGIANLQTYLHTIVCELHRKNVGYFWFEAFDEPYKNLENENAAEKHWGLYTSDRKKKDGITLPVMC